MSSTNGSNQIQDGTVEGMLSFLDWVVAKGYGTTAAVSPWRSATKQVVSTVEKKDDVSDVDVRQITLHDYLDRFEVLARGDLKVESIQAYRRRFTHAHQAYLAFLETGKPPAFRQGGSPRRPKAQSQQAQSPSTPVAAEPARPASAAAAEDRMVDYPFPLRSGQLAHLRLPAKLEKADAERLAAFVRTLVFEPMLELARGQGEGDGGQS